MKSIFDFISSRKPMKSMFNMSHSRKLSFQPGKLYPVMCEEVLPSDVWSYDMNTLIRFQPLQAPIMHLVDVYNYNFFVPTRIIMDDFETFITGGQDGDGKDGSGLTIEIPYTYISPTNQPGTAYGFTTYLGPGSLADHLGLSFASGATGTELTQINMLPFIAFWKVWCEYFRDPNLHPDYSSVWRGVFNNRGDITGAIDDAIAGVGGLPAFNIFSLPDVCWEKDYFTSALPFAQRGDAVEAPIQGNATVTYRTQALSTKTATANAGAFRAGTGANAGIVFTQDTSGTSQNVGIDNISSVNVSTAGFSINDLRTAARLQEWLEKMARGGYRYIEQMLSQFGVVSSDARLQRPEMLGGGKIPVSISEVLQTSENGTTPLANMAGHGIAAGQVAGYKRFFEEHGFVISFMFMRPRTAYQQGIRRVWTNRFDKLDWAWPSFAQLGEQEVLEKELYFVGKAGSSFDDDVFGYQQRYAEYKYIPSTVHGEFKSTLDFWHWGRIFTSRPTLSAAFVECDPDNRIFNVIDENSDPLYCIVSNRVNVVRPLPYQGTPTL